MFESRMKTYLMFLICWFTSWLNIQLRWFLHLTGKEECGESCCFYMVHEELATNPHNKNFYVLAFLALFIYVPAAA
jgi:hypothetical protein